MKKFDKSANHLEFERYDMQKRGCYVYFLVSGNTVVYVGRTEIHPSLRVFAHLENKKFDSYCFFDCGNLQESIELEFWNIAEYEPIYNYVVDWMPDGVINQTHFNRIYKEQNTQVRKELKALKPMFTLKGKLKYYYLSDVNSIICQK